MSGIVPEDQLPQELGEFKAVEAAYPDVLNRACDALRRRLPVMIECDKELTPFFFRCVRDRLKVDKLRCIYLDGRPDPNAPPPAMPQGLIGTMIGQLRDVVRGAVDERVVVLPHLDLLTTSSGGLTAEAREVIPLLYENPRILWLGFKDPSFLLPKVIENLFPHRETLIGTPRDRLRHLVTQREARKFGKGLNPFQIYKHVSGVNAIRLRRVLSSITGEDYPSNSQPALAQLRSATLGGELSIPELDLNKDIGGYPKVKERLTSEIIELLQHKEDLENEERIKRIEGLLPRGIIFWGPPGTGKTLFAKAMASSLGAAVTVVSGPELKSRWVGESEERIRQIFVQARQSAPAVIVFDELDSFASARGTYTGSGVEHSMVNQLLTEMDGFRKDELVFVVGTTNFVEILDPALLRPGRFEFHLEIPYPNSKDRKAIFDIYNKKLELDLSERAMSYAVKRTGDRVEGTGTRYSGDHLQALCRSIARSRLRGKIKGQADVPDVEEALTKYLDRPELTPKEERVVATHEAGHAVVALFTPNSPPIERISIQGDLGGALGYVKHADPKHRYVITKNQLLDRIAVMFGGREAESLLLDDISIGAAGDIEHATGTARALVEEFGFGDDSTGARQYLEPPRDSPIPKLSEAAKELVEANVRQILKVQQERAREIVVENRALVASLRDLLLERKVLDRQAFAHLLPGKKEEDNG